MSSSSRLQVRLFGRFSVSHNGHAEDGLGCRKAEELFAYLLLFRDRPHPRETLAGMLWGETSTVQSKKYLRQALWQLQNALRAAGEPARCPTLLTAPDWVQFNPAALAWVDVVAFEERWTRVRHLPAREVDGTTAPRLEETAGIYRGDLLGGWYQDWCLRERERFQGMYLGILEKLLSYCEAHQAFEQGVVFAEQILRCDRAHERAYQHLMRLHYQAGDCTGALRQYQRCMAALKDELDVEPSADTARLYQQIREQRCNGAPSPSPPLLIGSNGNGKELVPEAFDRLTRLETVLTGLLTEVQQEIASVRGASRTAHQGRTA